MAMDRKEATTVLREIIGECDGLLSLTCVSISPTPERREDSFELRIHCDINAHLRKCISNVLKKHHLSMKESDSSMIISQAES